MNPQPEQDMDKRLQQIEAEINAAAPVIIQPPQPNQSSSASTPEPQPLQSVLNQFLNWFNELPGTGKIVTGVVVFLVGTAILQAVLKLVVSAISLVLLAGLVYFGYKFFVANSSKNQQ